MNVNPPKRGRPPKVKRDFSDTKEALLQHGMATFTEQGFSTIGIDAILKQVGVPKGSFYYYFKSKEDFGLQVIARYDEYFCGKLFRHLNQRSVPAIERLTLFVDDACRGMEKYQFRRACLIGNFAQEANLLSDTIVTALEASLQNWIELLTRCFEEAKEQGALDPEIDCHAYAEFFWTGWEGAIMRSRITKTTQTLHQFVHIFLKSITQK
jgi:TetR/AcrR family transcriptional repressor of nem operon